MAAMSLVMSAIALAGTPTQPAAGLRTTTTVVRDGGKASATHFCPGGRVVFARATGDDGRTVPLVFVDTAGRPVATDAVGVRLKDRAQSDAEVMLVCGG